jgi:hypothetical protein
VRAEAVASRWSGHAALLAAVLTITVGVAVQAPPAARAATAAPVNDSIVANPSLPNGLMPAGQGRIAEDGSRSYLRRPVYGCAVGDGS